MLKDGQMQRVIGSCGDCSIAPILHKNLAFFYRSTGRINAAEEELQKALSSDPNDSAAREVLSSREKLSPPAADLARPFPLCATRRAAHNPREVEVRS
jgi:hypothetical protein